MRAFIAIALPPQIVRCIDDLEQKLEAYRLGVRWVRPQNVHLTLKFLGEIESAQVDAVAAGMTLAGAGFTSLSLSMQGLGVFPGIRKPRVFWSGIGGQTDLLARLQAKLDQALAEAGFAAERRPFKAHLTLGRFKRQAPSDKLVQAMREQGCYAAAVFEAHELILFKSVLRPQGAVYTPLQRCRFGASQP